MKSRPYRTMVIMIKLGCMHIYATIYTHNPKKMQGLVCSCADARRIDFLVGYEADPWTSRIKTWSKLCVHVCMWYTPLCGNNVH